MKIKHRIALTLLLFLSFIYASHAQKARYSARIESATISNYSQSFFSSHGLALNRHLQIRGGAGIIVELSSSPGTQWYKESHLSIPLFAEVSGMMLKRKISPTYLLRVGVENIFTTRNYYSSSYDDPYLYRSSYNRHRLSFFANPAIGCAFQGRKVRIEPFAGLHIHDKAFHADEYVNFTFGLALTF